MTARQAKETCRQQLIDILQRITIIQVAMASLESREGMTGDLAVAAHRIGTAINTLSLSELDTDASPR